MNFDRQNCITACQLCYIDCRSCLVAMAGKPSDNDCPNCCLQCMDACLTCINALVGNARHTKEYCLLCSEVFQWCAQQCGEHGHEHCKVCAASCLVCAKACRSMAG